MGKRSTEGKKIKAFGEGKGKEKRRGKVKGNKRDREEGSVMSDEEVLEAIHVPRPAATSSSSSSSRFGGKKRHKQELDDLAQKDPEFYNFLQENDASLLDFGEDSDDGDDYEGDEDADDEDDGMNEVDSDDEVREHYVEVTPVLLKKLKKNAETSSSMTTLKKLLSIFRTACIPLTGDENEDSARKNTFVISSPEIYEVSMTTVLQSAHMIFYNMLSLPSAVTREYCMKVADSTNWKKVQRPVLSFFKSVLHILHKLVDTMKQDQVSIFILSSLEPYVPLLAPLPRLAKALLKTLLAIWAKGSTLGEDFDLRGHAYLRIRQMAMVLPDIMTEECFRSIYLSYARFLQRPQSFSMCMNL